MDTEIKSMGLLTQVTKGLLLHSKKETEEQLGDRSKYIGMSDIGKGTECMRAAVANKVYGNMQPNPEDVQKSFSEKDFGQIQSVLNKQLILQRGHWLEAGILDAFKANNANIISQLEIGIDNNGIPIKAHLDFVLVWGGKHPAVRVLELKSTENIPKNLYASYETQLYGQLGFLCKFWNEPCFNKMTFPQLVKKKFNIELPENPQKVDIEGWCLCLAMSKAKAIGPYKANDTMLRFCEKTAKNIWVKSEEIRKGKMSLDDVEYCKGFHPLCDWCSHAEGCPKFKSVELKDSVYNDILSELGELKADKSKLEKEIAVNEERVKDFYLNCGVKNKWLNTGDYRFKCSTVNGRKILSEEMLASKLANSHGTEKASQVIEQSKKQGEAYQRLYISKINKEK